MQSLEGPISPIIHETAVNQHSAGCEYIGTIRITLKSESENIKHDVDETNRKAMGL